MTPFIFSVCDQNYSDRFHDCFVNSAEYHGHKVKIFCTNEFALTEKDRAWLVYWRFHLLPDLLKEHEAVLMVDMDSVFRGHIDIDGKFDAGIFLRDNAHEVNKKVLGSAFYCTSRAIELAQWMSDSLRKEPDWYWDQRKLWRMYQKFNGQYDFFHMGPKFISWDCHDESLIWTGKGSRKDWDETFRAECASWEGPGSLQEASHKAWEEKAEKDNLRSSA